MRVTIETLYIAGIFEQKAKLFLDLCKGSLKKQNKMRVKNAKHEPQGQTVDHL